jgi:hypothetical protein
VDTSFCFWGRGHGCGCASLLEEWTESGPLYIGSEHRSLDLLVLMGYICESFLTHRLHLSQIPSNSAIIAILSGQRHLDFDSRPLQSKPFIRYLRKQT